MSLFSLIILGSRTQPLCMEPKFSRGFLWIRKLYSVLEELTFLLCCLHPVNFQGVIVFGHVPVGISVPVPVDRVFLVSY